ncbi:MAG TPA: PqqD family protein [Pyrinomonadaceae bacterium]|jgi:hypothetical protein
MKKRDEQRAPKARQQRLVVEELPDELLVYDLDRHRAHCLNSLAAYVWKQCDGVRSVAQIARLLESETGRQFGEEAVWVTLDQLSRFRLLEERLPLPSGMAGVTRRELVRKYLPAALSLPLIISLAAPSAAQTATCGAIGTGCATNARCCSNLCVAGQCMCLGAAPGSACTSDANCCSPATCSTTTPRHCCLEKNQTCTQNNECCSGNCTGFGSLKCT